MIEYHLVRAGSLESIAIFDRWDAATRKAWHAAARKEPVNLLCMWPCGCVRRATARLEERPPVARFVENRLVRGRAKTVHQHVGWRIVEQCAEHKRRRSPRVQIYTDEAPRS